MLNNNNNRVMNKNSDHKSSYPPFYEPIHMEPSHGIVFEVEATSVSSGLAKQRTNQEPDKVSLQPPGREKQDPVQLSDKRLGDGVGQLGPTIIHSPQPAHRNLTCRRRWNAPCSTKTGSTSSSSVTITSSLLRELEKKQEPETVPKYNPSVLQGNWFDERRDPKYQPIHPPPLFSSNTKYTSTYRGAFLKYDLQDVSLKKSALKLNPVPVWIPVSGNSHGKTILTENGEKILRYNEEKEHPFTVTGEKDPYKGHDKDPFKRRDQYKTGLEYKSSALKNSPGTQGRPIYSGRTRHFKVNDKICEKGERGREHKEEDKADNQVFKDNEETNKNIGDRSVLKIRPPEVRKSRFWDEVQGKRSEHFDFRENAKIIEQEMCDGSARVVRNKAHEVSSGYPVDVRVPEVPTGSPGRANVTVKDTPSGCPEVPEVLNRSPGNDVNETPSGLPGNFRASETSDESPHGNSRAQQITSEAPPPSSVSNRTLRTHIGFADSVKVRDPVFSGISDKAMVKLPESNQGSQWEADCKKIVLERQFASEYKTNFQPNEKIEMATAAKRRELQLSKFAAARNISTIAF